LTSLNLANNGLGNIVLPEGWTKQLNSERTKCFLRGGPSAYEYKHIDGTVQGDNPGKPEGVIAIANAIPDMRALTKLNVSDNKMAGKEVGEAFGEMLRTNSVLKELDVSKNYDCYAIGAKDGPGFAHGIAKGLPDNRALTSLNLASNNLKAEGGKIVAEAIKVTNCGIAVVLAPFSCPSDHWLNCCCLLLSTG
jgi:hypothetical protein